MASKKDVVSAAEWKTRVDLAAAYRLFHLLGMTDLIYTHMSARVPDEEGRFLINPYGLMFHEVTASSLVKVDINGNLAEDSEYDANPAGFTIHSAIHMARKDVGCAIHLHTTAGMAVSAQAEGLLPLTQHSLRWYNRIAYHDYEGIALNHDERERLTRDLGNHHSMILRNHGLLTVGQDVPEAAVLMYYLEQSCRHAGCRSCRWTAAGHAVRGSLRAYRPPVRDRLPACGRAGMGCAPALDRAAGRRRLPRLNFPSSLARRRRDLLQPDLADRDEMRRADSCIGSPQSKDREGLSKQ